MDFSKGLAVKITGSIWITPNVQLATGKQMLVSTSPKISKNHPGWWLTYPSQKFWKSVGMIILNIWKNKKMFQTTNQSSIYTSSTLPLRAFQVRSPWTILLVGDMIDEIGRQWWPQQATGFFQPEPSWDKFWGTGKFGLQLFFWVCTPNLDLHPIRIWI